MDRRQFLKAGAAACALAAGGYLIGSSGKKTAVKESAQEPGPWRWSKKAYDYVGLGREVRCTLCPNMCVLEDRQRGLCRVRENYGGELISLAYGNPCAVHVDPIEKKPLYHFLPATGAFSIATAGCNLSCLNCQNWNISQKSPEETRNVELMPKDVVGEAVKRRCSSIAYTYTEPTVYYEYMYDTSVKAMDAGVRNVWVTSGYINEEPLKRLCKVLDAANVDLKGFSDETYMKLNGGTLQPVLDALKTLKKEGVWFEVTHLAVPTWTDDPDTISEMCGWLVKKLGSEYPLHLSRFHPQYKLTDLPPTPVEFLEKARKIAYDAGLEHVYIGNVAGKYYSDTICPNCGKTLIKRRGYIVDENNIVDGACRYCGREIAGVWG